MHEFKPIYLTYTVKVNTPLRHLKPCEWALLRVCLLKKWFPVISLLQPVRFRLMRVSAAMGNEMSKSSGAAPSSHLEWIKLPTSLQRKPYEADKRLKAIIHRKGVGEATYYFSSETILDIRNIILSMKTSACCNAKSTFSSAQNLYTHKTLIYSISIILIIADYNINIILLHIIASVSF